VSRLSLGPCLAARAAWVAASGTGPATRTASGTGQVLAGSAGVRTAFRLTSWASVHLLADVVAPLDRQSFVIQGGGTVFRPSAVAFRGGLGVDAHFSLF
jgi:hypothetical protein